MDDRTSKSMQTGQTIIGDHDYLTTIEQRKSKTNNCITTIDQASSACNCPITVTTNQGPSKDNKSWIYILSADGRRWRPYGIQFDELAKISSFGELAEVRNFGEHPYGFEGEESS